MPTGVDALTINLDNVNSMARRFIMPGIEDGVYNSNTTAMEFKKIQQTVAGYTMLTGAIQYAEGPGGPYEGTQPLDINDAQTITSWQARWKTHMATGTVTLFDQDRTNSPDAIADLFTEKYGQMQETLANYIGIGLNSDGSNSADYVGIPVQVAATGSVLGISKTLNPWWASPIDSTTTLAGLSLDTLRTLRSRATQGARRPGVILTTKTIWNRIYALSLSQQRWVNTQVLKQGFTEMAFEDMSVLEDSHIADGRLNMLDMKTWHYKVNRNRNMYMTGWKPPHNPPTYVTNYILHMACLICKNPRFNAAATALL